MCGQLLYLWIECFRYLSLDKLRKPFTFEILLSYRSISSSSVRLSNGAIPSSCNREVNRFCRKDRRCMCAGTVSVIP
jgi:hypothetical protein